MWYVYLIDVIVFLAFFGLIFSFVLVKKSHDTVQYEKLSLVMLIGSQIWIIFGIIVFQSATPGSWFTIIQGFVVFYLFCMHLSLQSAVVCRICLQSFKICWNFKYITFTSAFLSLIPCIIASSLIGRHGDWKIGNGFYLGDVSMESLGGILEAICILVGLAFIFLFVVTVVFYRKRTEILFDQFSAVIVTELLVFLFLFYISMVVTLGKATYISATSPLVFPLLVYIIHIVSIAVIYYKKYSDHDEDVSDKSSSVYIA